MSSVERNVTELTVGSFLEQMHSLDYGMVDHMLDENVLFLDRKSVV